MSCLPSRKRHHTTDDRPTEGGGNRSNVKVVIRIRPQNVKEVEGNYRVVVEAVDENILVFDPKENRAVEFGGKRGRRDIRKRPNRDLKFAFDRVFGPDARNADIYKETTDSVLSGLLDGYNCSVFAYGSTGSGKTYTMLGSREQPGVMYHTMVDLYSRMESIKDNTICNIAVSYLEVYNETIRDLLMPGHPLPIREDPGKGVLIPGLSLHKPKTADELLYMLQFGNQHRSQHPTDANAESSRSHAVFQVFVRQQDRTANISTEVRVAKMCLVDLAGSERATVTKNSGSRFREGANINRSLLALGNVINALADNKNKGFVPYRDSKLTRLLKDSLGGNCQTVMIAAVSPSAMSFEDTYNTLRYADRAKNIKATLKKNVLNVDFHMAKYGQIVTELRKEISELKNKLNNYEEGKNLPVSVAVRPDMSSFIGYQKELDKFFTSHLTMRSDQLEQDICLRNLQWKLYRKNRCLARVKAINDTEAQAHLESVVKGMNQKSSCMTVSSEMSRGKLAQDLDSFHDINHRMKQQGNSDSQIIDLCAEGHINRLELQDTKQCLSFTKQVIRCQDRELHHNERLVLQLLKLLKNQHFILKGHKILTCDLEEEFKDIVKKVGGKELTWGDQLEDNDSPRRYNLSEMLDLPTMKLRLSQTDMKGTHPQASRKDIATNRNKQSVWPAQHTADKPLPYTQVDECSPPKAKRVMFTHQSVQQTVRNETGKCRQRQRNGNHSTSHQTHCVSSGRSRSFSESNIRKNQSVDLATNGKSTNNPINVPLRVLQSNINEKEISPDCEIQTNSKFSKINDTIMKAKKFSSLHTKNVDKKTEDTHSKDETDDLDGTFTIEPHPNESVPLPSLNVDAVCSQCQNSETCVNNSSDKCTQCELQRHRKTSRTTDNENDLGISVLNTTFDTDGCKSDRPNANDSNTSTLVNQSASSQSSLASVSTLVENLSQNLSNIEENDSIIENLKLSTQIDRDISAENTHSLSVKLPRFGETVTKAKEGNVQSVKVPVGSQTVTKTRRSLDTYKDGIQAAKNSFKVNEDENSGKHTKAARCINFGNSNDKDGCSPSVMATKTPDRKPLQQVCNSNTPQTDRSSLGSSIGSTDSNMSFDKSSNKEKMSRTKLFEKENCKSRSNFGLPLLSEGSLLIKDMNKSKKPVTTDTPGYMQSTKAYTHRVKHNKSMISDSDKVDNGPGRVRTSMQSQRPLTSSMRCKSLSNLSSRSGWQF